MVSVEELGKCEGDFGLQDFAVVAAGLEHKDRDIGVFAQPTGEDRASRAATDNDCGNSEGCNISIQEWLLWATDTYGTGSP